MSEHYFTIYPSERDLAIARAAWLVGFADGREDGWQPGEDQLRAIIAQVDESAQTAAKEAEPPHMPYWEHGDPWETMKYWYAQGKRDEHARAVEVIKHLAERDWDDENNPAEWCWCELLNHAEYCLAARAYCEEKD